MFRNLMYRWSHFRNIQIGCLEAKKQNLFQKQYRLLSISVPCCKKRRPAEEKAAETGRRAIRYSPKASSEVVGIWRNMTVRDIAQVLKKDVDHVLKTLEFADKDSGARYSADSVIRSADIVKDIVKISGLRFKLVAPPHQEEDEGESKDAVPAPPAPAWALVPRPAVACVMGHVDHGKTSLLDALRHARVAASEPGGITQHIGAFQVTLSNGCSVTFLDTPGHAAFGAMRARGAAATDVVVLVVAADAGVQDQTLEAIRMADDAGVPLLVAINKIDKPAANIERTLAQLAGAGVVCEALGGAVQAVAVSAREPASLPALVEALALQAQLLELRADPAPPAEGVVLEAQVDPKIGKAATVLVRRGTLRRGAVLVAGLAWAKVRSMKTAEGAVVEEAPPSTPVVVLGWRALPAAGATALQVPDERRANEVMRWRHAQHMRSAGAAAGGAAAAAAAAHRETYRAQLAARRAAGRVKERPAGPRPPMLAPDTHPELAILVKGDVCGSVEAIEQLVATYDEHERVRLRLVHAAVGPPAPSDLEIAEAFDAIIYLFNVEMSAALAAEAARRGLPVRSHRVIYQLLEDVRRQLSARLPPRAREEVLGEARVVQPFQVSVGRRRVPVAGARCERGQLLRDARYRLLRRGALLYDGKLASMKHLKEEVGSIARGLDCGLMLADPDVQVEAGDVLVCYRLVEEPAETGWNPV